MKRVLITGSKGQDGTLLKQLLESQGLEVFCFVRPPEKLELTLQNLQGNRNISEFYTDLSNFESCLNSVALLNPDTIFHLAAVHAPGHIMGTSTWATNREKTYKTHVSITKNLVNVILEANLRSQLIVAGSSRMYTPLSPPLIVDENTATSPIDYYGATKVEAWENLIAARNRTGLPLKMAILFNHESKFRKQGYLFRDLARQIKLYESGVQDFIEVMNPNYRGDWHAAEDTVKGLQLMANHEEVSDLVLASGKLTSVREIIESYFGIYLASKIPKIVSKNNNLSSKNNISVVGNTSLAKSLGWIPNRSLESVLHELVINGE